MRKRIRDFLDKYPYQVEGAMFTTLFFMVTLALYWFFVTLYHAVHHYFNLVSH